jgi:hypothetical protein
LPSQAKQIGTMWGRRLLSTVASRATRPFFNFANTASSGSDVM